MKPLVAALLLLTVQQTADLSWKPVVGQEHRYAMTLTSSFDMGQGPAELLVKMKVSEKVKAVSDKSVTVESLATDTTISINGSEMDQGATQQPAMSYERGLDTMPVLADQDTSPMARTNRGIMASSFPRPTKPLAVGDSHRWSIKGDQAKGTVDGEGKLTLKGEEKINGIDCWKLDYVYSESIQTQPTSAIGTLWMAKSDATLIKSVMNFENYKSVNMMPASTAHVVMELIKPD
jgi:hypothetical protein